MAVPSFVGVADGRNGNPEGTTSLTLSIPSGSVGDLLNGLTVILNLDRIMPPLEQFWEATHDFFMS